MNTKLNLFFYSIYVNGQKYRLYVKKYSTLINLINFLQYLSIANLNIIEHNGQITNLLKNTSNNLYIQNNDEIEIITVVGGG